LNCPCFSFCDSGQLFDNALDLISRQQAEIKEFRIAVKSYKGKYESAVKTAKELQTVIAEKDAVIERSERSNSISQHLLSDAYDSVERLDKLNETIRAEAVKEFEKRFEDKINEIDFPKYAVVEKMLVICKQMMNDIVKEMVGEQG
jgi:hypothetical protein